MYSSYDLGQIDIERLRSEVNDRIEYKNGRWMFNYNRTIPLYYHSGQLVFNYSASSGSFLDSVALIIYDHLKSNPNSSYYNVVEKTIADYFRKEGINVEHFFTTEEKYQRIMGNSMPATPIKKEQPQTNRQVTDEERKTPCNNNEKLFWN